MAFKTQEELFSYLVQGGKITYSTWASDYYVHFVDGVITDCFGTRTVAAFNDSSNWRAWIGPQAKTSRTFYRRKWVLDGDDLRTDIPFMSSKEKFDALCTGYITSDEWQERTIEAPV